MPGGAGRAKCHLPVQVSAVTLTGREICHCGGKLLGVPVTLSDIHKYLGNIYYVQSLSGLYRHRSEQNKHVIQKYRKHVIQKMTDVAYIQSPVQPNLNLPSHLTSYYHKLHQLSTLPD